MKKLVLFVCLLAFNISIFGQNIFNFTVRARGGIIVGLNGIKIDSITTSNDTLSFWHGGSQLYQKGDNYPASGIAVSTGSSWGTSITNNSTDWNTAYSDRLKWDGGNAGLVASDGRTSLGGTTVGQAFFTLANPSAIRVPIIQANNSITATATTGTGNVVLSASPILSGTVALGSGSITMTGSLAATGSRVLKGWFTDLEITNLPTINGYRMDSVLIPYSGAVKNINLGNNSLGITGSIGGIGAEVNHGYFNDLTVKNPLRANIRSDSIIWAEGDTIRTIALKDSVGFSLGNYMTRQNYINDPTNQEFVKNARELGSVYKYFPLRCDYTFNLHGTLSGTRAIFTYYYIPQKDTITGVKYSLYTAGDYNQKDFNGIALYSESGGNLTQVAISANDSVFLCITANTLGTIDFTSPAVVDPGSYYVVLLYNYNSYVAHPDIYSCDANLNTALINNQFPNSNRLSAYKDAITTLVGYEPAMSVTAALSTVQGLILY